MAEAAGTGIGGLGWMYAAGTFIDMIGLHSQGRSARIAGERARAAGEFARWQAERDAGLAIAISQRRSQEERRQGELTASRALAVAAASGAGVADPTMVNILAAAEGEAAYRSAVALYEGETEARRLRFEGLSASLAGSEAAEAGYRAQQGYALAAGGRGLRAAGSLYARYGMGGPGTNPHEGALDQYELFSGQGMLDPRYG